MDQEGVIVLTVSKGDRKYSFSMPHGANFGEAYDAAHEVLFEIVEMSKRSTERLKRKEEVADANEEAAK